MRRFWCSALALGFWLFVGFDLLAYTDNIAAPKEEVWAAAVEVLRPYGIRAQNAEKGILESGWIVGESMRTKKLGGMIKKKYLRQTRLRISIQPRAFQTTLTVKASFRYRAKDASPRAPWRFLTPSASDKQIEYEFFKKILRRLELRRSSSP